MNKLKRITHFCAQINFPLDHNELQNNFSKQEIHHIDRLLDRCNYLHRRIVNKEQATIQKSSLERDEFRAIEWILWELGIFDGEFKKIEFPEYDKNHLKE